MSRKTAGLRTWLFGVLPCLGLMLGCGTGDEAPVGNAHFHLQWRLEDARSGAVVLCEPGEKVRLVAQGLDETRDCTDRTDGDRTINGVLAAVAPSGRHEARLELLDSAGTVISSTPVRFTLTANAPSQNLGVQRLPLSTTGATGRLVLTWQQKSSSGPSICGCALGEVVEVEAADEGVQSASCASFDAGTLVIEAGVYGKEFSLSPGTKRLTVRLKEDAQGATSYWVDMNVTLVPGRRVHQHVVFMTCS